MSVTPLFTPVQPFEILLEELKAKLQRAESDSAVRVALTHGIGVLRGYYLAGGVCEVAWRTARDALQAESHSRLAVSSLRNAVEVCGATR